MRKQFSCSKTSSPVTGLAFCGSLLFLCLAVSPPPALGQTFLEKLESAVRERINNSNSAPEPNAVPAISTTEELPRPPASGATPGQPRSGNAILDTTQSVLETSAGSTVPAAGPVPPPIAENSVAAAPAGRRIYLGLEAEEVTGGGIGVKISSVTQGSPAWKAGFERGDRIMAIGGFAIANLENMVEQLGKAVPGQSVKFLISRSDRNIELIAVLMEAGVAERIAGAALPMGELNQLPAAGPPWLGVLVNDLSSAFRNQFGLTVFRGAAVTTVAAGSPAAGVGMMAGDAITSIGGVSIETARELMAWLETARPGQIVDITYQRGAVTRTAKLTLEISPSSRPQRSANRADVSAAGRSTPPSNRAPNPPTLQDSTGDAPAATVANSVPPTTAGPTVGIIPNAIPKPQPIASTSADVAELQREVAELKSELEKANQRLESTQNRLKQILEGLGNN